MRSSPAPPLKSRGFARSTIVRAAKAVAVRSPKSCRQRTSRWCSARATLIPNGSRIFEPMSAELPDFTQARVLVVGDLMLDRYWIGPTSRISPEAPVPVVRIRKDETRHGGAAHVALNIGSLGAHASVLGVVGEIGRAHVCTPVT